MATLVAWEAGTVGLRWEETEGHPEPRRDRQGTGGTAAAEEPQERNSVAPSPRLSEPLTRRKGSHVPAHVRVSMGVYVCLLHAHTVVCACGIPRIPCPLPSIRECVHVTVAVLVCLCVCIYFRTRGAGGQQGRTLG